MSEYSLSVDGIKALSEPCYYLSHILEFSITSGEPIKSLKFRSNKSLPPDIKIGSLGFPTVNMDSAEAAKIMGAPLIFMKFMGDTHSDTKSGFGFRYDINGRRKMVFETYGGFNVGIRDHTQSGIYFIPSPFWNFKLYCCYPVHSAKLWGYGIATLDEQQRVTFVSASSEEIVYVRGLKIGNYSSGRLYAPLTNRTEGGVRYFDASDKNGGFAGARCLCAKQMRSVRRARMLSIADFTSDEERIMHDNGRYFVLTR
ncbi:hypothetical protein KRX11_10030 [Pasteurellaceae bacterium TAE3-ERU1]|uniref:hypothetical protein n=1 Tax=Spirabiliibacterium mucosae TaxID=28156 RepID=UPI001AAC792E|nr:hypothetical protein [Spirabiliibacterium mucosae]MBE2898066.1 hypothetical protein [Spirabiliibacterium mucosae]MBV7388971.1 hypothetical protein [Pasteurellaceae bacterium TAE3-ERU1]